MRGDLRLTPPHTEPTGTHRSLTNCKPKTFQPASCPGPMSRLSTVAHCHLVQKCLGNSRVVPVGVRGHRPRLQSQNRGARAQPWFRTRMRDAGEGGGAASLREEREPAGAPSSRAACTARARFWTRRAHRSAARGQGRGRGRRHDPRQRWPPGGPRGRQRTQGATSRAQGERQGRAARGGERGPNGVSGSVGASRGTRDAHVPEPGPRRRWGAPHPRFCPVSAREPIACSWRVTGFLLWVSLWQKTDPTHTGLGKARPGSRFPTALPGVKGDPCPRRGHRGPRTR